MQKNRFWLKDKRVLKKIAALVIIIVSIAVIAFFLTQKPEPDRQAATGVNLANKTDFDTRGLAQGLAAGAKKDQVEAVLDSQKPSPSMQITQKQTTTANQPQTVINQNKTYQAVLKTTQGEIVIALDVVNTPVAANNFVYLALNKFYDNTIFHRIIKGFMIQGGDPKGDGTGGPGYSFPDEPITGEYKRGTVAMANSGPNTNGSQFFIMHADYDLPKSYVIFGQVVSGMETVDKIAEAQVTIGSGGEQSQPVSPIVVQAVEIIEQ